MPIICEDIPNTEDAKKALFANILSMVHVRYEGESKIPGIDATKLAPCVLPAGYRKLANEIEVLNVLEDDVWVTSFPKSGTTWTQEMVWLIVNDLDFDRSKAASLFVRYSTLERSSILSDVHLGTDKKNSVEVTEDLPRPRMIKTHLPISLLPTDFWTVKPKLVYVVRNPKDAAISYYRHFSNLHRYMGSLEDFLDTFLKDAVCWAPYSDQVLGYWKLRNEPNILFIRYEDMSRDLISVLHCVAKFFNKTFTDDQYKQLANHLSFDEMRKNRAVNFEKICDELERQYGGKRVDPNFHFIRRGQVNSAKDEMPVEYQKRFDDWMAEAFKGSDFEFSV